MRVVPEGGAVDVTPKADGAEFSARVHAELERILGSATFSLSQRHRNFLTYIVDETLAGRGDRIKAYTIATSALGRDENFDPQRDSIVRIEAGRIRRELERYYLTEGAGASLRIEIPKGAYVPQFVAGAAGVQRAPVEPRAQRSYRGPRLLVIPFERSPESEGYTGFERAFARQVIAGLARFTTIMVFGPETARRQGTDITLHDLTDSQEVDYVLTGTLMLTPGLLAAELLLQEVPKGRFVWAERFERPFEPSNLHALRDEIASLIVQRLAQPYGVLHSRALDYEGDAPSHLRSYLAVLEYHELLHTFDFEKIHGIRERLELAIREDPHFAEAFACLSMVETTLVRFKSQPVCQAGAILERSITLARQAILLAPNSSRAHHALAMALWFSGEIAESLETYHRALSLNPFDTDVMAELALRYAVQMDWQKALPLVQECFQRNPNQPDAYHMVPFLYHFAEGHAAEALKHARRINVNNMLYGQLAVAAAAALGGKMELAQETVQNVERMNPGYGQLFLADARSRNLHPVLTDRLAEALHKAGMPGLLEDEDRPAKVLPKPA